MSNGFLLGASAAVAWGIADVLVTVYARRIGFFRALLVIHGCSVVMLAALALALGESLALTGGQWAASAALGGVAIVAYAGFYRALELGPIAIVSPVASANGALIVLLAVFVLGEALSTGQAIGCALVVGFIALASIEPVEEEAPGSGIRLAILAAVAFSVYLFSLARLAEELGWLLPILLTRTVAVTILAGVAVAGPVGSPRALGALGVVGCAAAGCLDACGYLFFNRGGEIGEVAVTGAASSAYPVIPILVGLVALRERVAWHQLVGVAGVLIGMVVLSLG